VEGFHWNLFPSFNLFNPLKGLFKFFLLKEFGWGGVIRLGKNYLTKLGLGEIFGTLGFYFLPSNLTLFKAWILKFFFFLPHYFGTQNSILGSILIMGTNKNH